MTRTVLPALGLAQSALAVLPAAARVSEQTLQSIAAPDKVETRIGTLEFTDGAPSAATAGKVYDALDFTRCGIYFRFRRNSGHGRACHWWAPGRE